MHWSMTWRRLAAAGGAAGGGRTATLPNSATSCRTPVSFFATMFLNLVFSRSGLSLLVLAVAAYRFKPAGAPLLEQLTRLLAVLKRGSPRLGTGSAASSCAASPRAAAASRSPASSSPVSARDLHTPGRSRELLWRTGEGSGCGSAGKAQPAAATAAAATTHLVHVAAAAPINDADDGSAAALRALHTYAKLGSS